MHNNFLPLQDGIISLQSRIIKSTSVVNSVGDSIEACCFRSGSYHEWCDEQMEGAVAAVHSGQAIRKAAVMYHVPRSTLSDRITGRVDITCKPGKKPYLTRNEEEEISTFLKRCARIGYPFTKKKQ